MGNPIFPHFFPWISGSRHTTEKYTFHHIREQFFFAFLKKAISVCVGKRWMTWLLRKPFLTFSANSHSTDFPRPFSFPPFSAFLKTLNSPKWNVLAYLFVLGLVNFPPLQRYPFLPWGGETHWKQRNGKFFLFSIPFSSLFRGKDRCVCLSIKGKVERTTWKGKKEKKVMDFPMSRKIY